MNSSRFSKPVRDFPNYTVDIHGRVCNRFGQELKPYVINGYFTVNLYANGRRKNCLIHRLVADAFFDGKHEGFEVNHIDGNKQNNFIGNLELADRSENVLTDEIRQKGSRAAVKTNRQRVKVLETGEIFESLSECAQTLHCRLSEISKCCHGYQKRHHDYHFAFMD